MRRLATAVAVSFSTVLAADLAVDFESALLAASMMFLTLFFSALKFTMFFSSSAFTLLTSYLTGASQRVGAKSARVIPQVRISLLFVTSPRVKISSFLLLTKDRALRLLGSMLDGLRVK